MIDLLPNSNYIKNFVRRLGREGFFSCFIIFQWPKILASWPVISLGLFFPPEKLAAAKWLLLFDIIKSAIFGGYYEFHASKYGW